MPKVPVRDVGRLLLLSGYSMKMVWWMVDDCSDERKGLWYATKDKSWKWRCQKGVCRPALVFQGAARVPGAMAPLAPTSVGSPAHRSHVTC